MRHLHFFLPGLFVLCFLSACEVPASEQGDNSSSNTGEEVTNELNVPHSSQAAKAGQCLVDAQVLKGNVRVDTGNDLEVYIRADSTTNDPQLGPSHRVLEVYQRSTCKRLAREVLPVNSSPDMPYYLSDIVYNQGKRQLGIRGVQTVLYYDLSEQLLYPGLQPRFLNERPAQDAQSGHIRHLETWERYLIGYAQDQGTFVFDLQNPAQAKAVLPTMEYAGGNGQYQSLFLLPSGKNDARQILMPYYDFNSGKLEINAMLDQPRQLSLQSSADQQFLIASYEEGKTGIDLKRRKAFAIPPNLQQQAVEQLFSWIGSQI